MIRLRTARFAVGTVLAVQVLALAGSRGGPSSPGVVGPTRSYRMGWAPTPPRGHDRVHHPTAQEMSEVSDVALVQQTVPWTDLLGAWRPFRGWGSWT